MDLAAAALIYHQTEVCHPHRFLPSHPPTHTHTHTRARCWQQCAEWQVVFEAPALVSTSVEYFPGSASVTMVFDGDVRYAACLAITSAGLSISLIPNAYRCVGVGRLGDTQQCSECCGSGVVFEAGLGPIINPLVWRPMLISGINGNTVTATVRTQEDGQGASLLHALLSLSLFLTLVRLCSCRCSICMVCLSAVPALQHPVEQPAGVSLPPAECVAANETAVDKLFF